MSDEKSSSWLPCLSIGCLTVLLLTVGTGWYAYNRFTTAARGFAADGIEYIVDAAATDMKLSDKDKKELQGPIKALSARIRSGEIGLTAAAAIGKEIVESPVVNVVLIKGFEAKYLDKFKLDDKTRQQSHVILTRYAQAMNEKKVAESDQKPIEAIMFEEKVDKRGQKRRSLRETLSKEEMQKCLLLMRDAADKAKIPDQAFDYDLAKELQNAIDKGIAAAAKP